LNYCFPPPDIGGAYIDFVCTQIIRSIHLLKQGYICISPRGCHCIRWFSHSQALPDHAHLAQQLAPNTRAGRKKF